MSIRTRCQRAVVPAVVGAAMALGAMPVMAANVGDITEYPVTANIQPLQIVTGPDGNLWFTDSSDAISKMTPSGTVTDYPLAADSRPNGITVGPDGAIWFTEDGANKIGRITTAGVITDFTVPTAGAGPEYITTGPDGNLWFTEGDQSKVGKVTPAGVFNEYVLPTTNNPQGIAVGADGKLWVAEGSANKLATITTAGVVTEHDIPNPAPSVTAGGLDGIALGPDGNIWFGLDDRDRVARVTPTFAFTFFDQAANSGGEGTAAGPDGNIWVAESKSNKILRVTPAGLMREFTPPTANNGPSFPTTGPDCQVWFTETSVDKIGRVVTQLPAVSSVTPSSGPIAGGTSVTITGTDFYKVTAVTFGGKPAQSFTRNGCNSITAVAPANTAGTVDVRATTADGVTGVSAADHFTYVGPPPVLPKAGSGPDQGSPVWELLVALAALLVVPLWRRRRA